MKTHHTLHIPRHYTTHPILHYHRRDRKYQYYITMKYLSIFLILIAATLIPSLTWAAQDDISPGLLNSKMCITTYTSEPCGVGGELG